MSSNFGKVAVIMFVITHDIEYIFKFSTNLFKKFQINRLLTEIVGNTNIARQNQGISVFGVF